MLASGKNAAIHIHTDLRFCHCPAFEFCSIVASRVSSSWHIRKALVRTLESLRLPPNQLVQFLGCYTLPDDQDLLGTYS